MRDTISKRSLFICTGEASGDVYARFFVDAFNKKFSHAKMYGIGGNAMRESGVEIVEDCRELMTFGFTAGLSSSLKNYRIYRGIARQLFKIRPACFVAIAYPGLNLLLCRYAKRLGCSTYYLLPPQIWAWGKFRKYFIKKWVDRIISVYPFEYEFYKREGLAVEYVANPLFQELRMYARKDFQQRIGFMPGSRQNHMRRNFPVMVELMKRVGQKNAHIAFSLILYSQESLAEGAWITRRLDTLKGVIHNDLEIISEDRYQAMKNCDLLILSSGTASLEAAILTVPQIFFYRPSFFDYYLFKRFLTLEEYNLTNLYFDTKIVPSFVFRDKGRILHNLCLLVNNHISSVECHSF
jgi:lipid-A-disaccharide synthase